MITSSKKLLASLVAIAVIASAFTGLIMIGTVAAQPPTCPLDEDFSSWLPSGWATDDWYQSYTKYAEGSSPEALLYWNNITGDYAYLDSKPVYTSGALNLTLEFKSFIDDWGGGYNCTVYTRADGGDGWTDVTPWSNPIWGNIAPDSYSIDISPDIGTGTEVRFEFDGYYWNIDYWYLDDVKICGSIPTPPPLPTHLRYLHAEGGLINMTDPVGTQWHELWPFFCHEYYLSSWNDTSGDGILSHCDWVDMYEMPDGAVKPYHIEEVTITLYLRPELNALVGDGFGQIFLGEPMYVELEGGYDPAALTDPIGTQWHEIYPNFCTSYNLTDWDDTNVSGNLTVCDYILLVDKESGNYTSWHVEDIAVDIAVSREPPPVGGEAYPASKASLLAPWIAAAAAIAAGAGVLVLRRRRA